MTALEHPLDDALAFLGDRLRRDEPLAPLCTYRVGGHAARFVEVETVDQLTAIAGALIGVCDGSVDTVASVRVIGRGSNMLVADGGMPGLVLQLGEGFTTLDRIENEVEDVDEGVVVRAGGATSLPIAARKTVSMGLTGFEWAVGVPGSVGGAVRMNAGGHGSDMSEVLIRVRVVDLRSGNDEVVEPAALDLEYRASSISSTQVVASADLRLQTAETGDGQSRISEIVRWRRENQPGGPNAGSVFTNPPGESAGRLIDESGCRGLRVGSAEVSRKHANFIQADAGGSADDVAAVMATVVEQVHARTGVVLHAETVLVGFPGAIRSAVCGRRDGGDADVSEVSGSDPL